MAGSYGHVRPVERAHGSDSDDTYAGKWSLIENMGDAYECVEELLWLVLYFANIASKTDTVEAADAAIEAVRDTIYFPMVRGEKPKDDRLRAVEKVMEG